MRNAKVVESTSAMMIRVIKAALVASILSIILVVAYAFLLLKEILPSNGLSIVNTCIKVICAAIAGIIAVRKCAQKRWLWGGIAGLVYSFLAFMIFSILADTFSLSLAVLSDLGMGLVSGMAAAMVIQIIK